MAQNKTRNKGTNAGFPKQVRGMNFFATDANLQTFLRRTAPGALALRQADLENFGAWCGGPLDEQADYTDHIHPPVWRAEPVDLTDPGTRRGRVYFNQRYEDCHQETYRRGFIARAFDKQNPEPHLMAFIAQYMISQSDIAIGCPYAMTHPVAYIIDRHAPDAVKKKLLHESTRADGKTKTGGTWATEKHSGSDIAGTTTKAVYQYDGTVRLYGQKWFTSNADSGLVIATARPEGAPEGAAGLGLYAVPKHLDDEGKIENHYEVTHIKDKLGTRGLATGEIKLDGAVAYEIVKPPQGLKVMMEALGVSRIHNAMAAAGVMRRAFLESLCWASHRAPFGKKLTEQPMVQKRILEIATEWMAGCALAFEAARSFDAAQKDENQRIWMRLVTALAKYKTAEQAVWCAQKAIGIVGGGGYVEEHPAARLFRDAMVLPVWEGPEQIQALELMRMIAGKEPGDAALMKKLKDIEESLPKSGMTPEIVHLGTMRAHMALALNWLRANPGQAATMADDYLHKLSDVTAYALLCGEAAWELQNSNDKTKLLACRAYYDRAFIRCLFPAKSTPEIQAHFKDVVTGKPVTAETGKHPALKPR